MNLVNGFAQNESLRSSVHQPGDWEVMGFNSRQGLVFFSLSHAWDMMNITSFSYFGMYIGTTGSGMVNHGLCFKFWN